MKTAMPIAMGAAMQSANTDEYSVPQMKGSAPNSPDTGSQVDVVQKPNPNFWIDSIDCRASSNPTAETMRISRAPKTPVPTLNPRSFRMTND